MNRSSFQSATTPPSEAETIEKEPNFIRRSSRYTQQLLRLLFYKLGYLVAGSPWITIGLSSLFCGLCMIGLTLFHTESRLEKLWVPQDTLALKHDRWTEDKYSSFVRPEFVIFTGKMEGADLANKEALLQMIDVMKFAEHTTVQFKGTKVSYDDVCHRITNGKLEFCGSLSVFDLFYDQAFLTTPPHYLDTVRKKIGSMSNIAIKKTISGSQLYTWNKKKIKRTDIFGGVSGDGENIQVSAMKVAVFLQNNLIVKDGKKTDERAESWEKQWVETIKSYVIPRTSTIKRNQIALVSQQEAIKESITGDTMVIGIGYILLTMYVCSFLGQFHRVKSRIILSIMGLFSIGLAIGATYGLSGLFGMFYGPVHQVLPLLLLAVGIDDAFVIVTAYDNLLHDKKNDNLPIRELVAKAISQAGTAITVTSLTNSCAFFIGSLTVLPALKYFAISAGIGILFDYLLQTTFFAACLTFDARRQAVNRCDVICLKAREEVARDDYNCFRLSPGVLARFFRNYFGPFITNKYIRLATLLITVSGFSACIYGFTQLKQNFQPEFFFIDGTYMKDYDNIEKSYFPQNNLPISIYTGKIDYPSVEVQKKMISLFNPRENNGFIDSNPYVEQNSLNSWFVDFRSFYNLSSSEVFDPEKYYQKLFIFIQSSSGGKFILDLVVDNATSTLVATRSSVLLTALNSNDDEVDAMKTLRSSVDQAKLEEAFPFSFMFIFFEQYAVIVQEAIVNICTSLAVVFGVTIILIGNPLVALVVFCGVLFSIIDILGILYFGGIDLNSISVVNLALAIGLCIDFSAHIGLAFMEAIGDRKTRIRNALFELGPPLIHGGVSTFLAISVLMTARSYIFRIFFKMFFLIIGLGMFHGLVVVPQILSLIGADGFYNSEHIKREEEEKIEYAVGNKQRISRIDEECPAMSTSFHEVNDEKHT